MRETSMGLKSLTEKAETKEAAKQLIRYLKSKGLLKKVDDKNPTRLTISTGDEYSVTVQVIGFDNSEWN